MGDALGSVRQLVDNDSVVVLARDYTPFGLVRSESGTGSSGYGFTGEQDAGYTQFVYLRTRWMDPQSGRFLSKDSWPGSIYQPSSLHKYLYVSANPVNRVDPTGKYECKDPYGCAWLPPSPLSPQLWMLSVRYADEYGIPVELLAGTIAVEIVHDTDWRDPYLDTYLLLLIARARGFADTSSGVCGLAVLSWDYLTGRGPGPGVANFHTRTARRVEEYFDLYYADSPKLKLPFSGKDIPSSYDRIVYLTTQGGSVHYTAAYLRMLADYRKGSGSLPKTQPHLHDLSDDDMTVINGAFRAGILGGWKPVERYQSAVRADDYGLLILPYLALYREH